MKTLTILATALLTSLSFGQSTLSGVWYSTDTETSELNRLEFHVDGSMISETLSETGEEKSLKGNYYYEHGSDLLVVILWHGDQAETLKFNFNINSDELVMKQFAPISTENTFFREGNLANN